MTKDKFILILREELRVKKEIIGVRAMKQVPSDIPIMRSKPPQGCVPLLLKF